MCARYRARNGSHSGSHCDVSSPHILNTPPHASWLRSSSSISRRSAAGGAVLLRHEARAAALLSIEVVVDRPRGGGLDRLAHALVPLPHAVRSYLVLVLLRRVAKCSAKGFELLQSGVLHLPYVAAKQVLASSAAGQGGESNSISKDESVCRHVSHHAFGHQVAVHKVEPVDVGQPSEHLRVGSKEPLVRRTGK